MQARELPDDEVKSIVQQIEQQPRITGKIHLKYELAKEFNETDIVDIFKMVEGIHQKLIEHFQLNMASFLEDKNCNYILRYFPHFCIIPSESKNKLQICLLGPLGTHVLGVIAVEPKQP